MRAEVVAIGSELLLGEAVDTNSAWISARLAEIGVDVHRHTTVGDNPTRMAAALADAAARADAVVVTGGLGPTQDDLTRQVVAELAGVPLVRHDDLAAHIEALFTARGRVMPPSNLVQADIPRGAAVLAPVGTAPGFAIDLPGGATAFCVPGVPREMQVMVERDVVPALAARSGAATVVSRVVRTAGMAESAVAEACAPLVERLEALGNPTMAFLASRGETRVRLTAKAGDRAAALALLDPLVDEVVQLLGAAVAGVDAEGAEHAVARALLARGWTLGLAESMTAGGVVARLSGVAGASRWLRGALVTYATDVKASVAGVDPGLLEREGPVSEPVAAALALGARDRLGADVGLAVVGVAGPATQGGRPVGTCCIAVATPADLDARARTVQLPGRSRADVQEFAASAALDALRRRLAAPA